MNTPPQVVITNGIVQAVVQLPDPIRGFYRATRFEWAGIITSLSACGHEFIGQWRETHDPLRHDCITGPAEEFQALDDPDVDYPLSAPGSEFLRLGVGLLRKPTEAPNPEDHFERFHTYDVVEPGVWHCECSGSAIHFRQTARSPTGLAVIYEKTVSLPKDETTLLLEHRLTNIGSRSIHTRHYNHNFFRIDGNLGSGDLVLRLPFAARPTSTGCDLLEQRDSAAPGFQTELSLIRPLYQGESVLTELMGSEATVPYKMELSDRASGAAIAISGDHPISRLLFWATPRTFCPEPYVNIDVHCGITLSWTVRYNFFDSSSTLASHS